MFNHDNNSEIVIGRSLERLAQKRPLEIFGFGKRFALGESQGWHWKREKKPVTIDLKNEPNPHMLIVGMSGFGKSTLCKALILELCNAGKKVMVFDVHNEHTDAIKSAGGRTLNALFAGINIFALDGMTVSDRISDLVSLLTDVYGLGNVQSALLSSCLWYTYRKCGAPSKTAKNLEKIPTMSDLIDELCIFQKFAKSPVEKQGIHSMRSKFLPLNNPAFNSNFVSLDDLRNSVLSFSLAKLKNKEARAIYINEMLKRLYISMKDNEREVGLRHYIMIDEAQFLIGNGNMAGDMIKRLMEEGRKYGVGLIVATHSASSMDRQIVANASTFVSFYSREPDEVEYVSGLLGGGDRMAVEQVRIKLMGLGRHEALVVKGESGAPVLVQTVTAAALKEKLTAKGSVVDENTKELKEDLILFSYRPVDSDAIDAHFGSTGSALADELVSEKRMRTMQWIENGVEKKWYMAYRGNLTIEHELNVKKISEGLLAQGIENIMTVSGTNKPDIIAFVKGRKIAIEYETGLKASEETKDMLGRRVRDYGGAYVFVADPHYERYLKNFGGENVRVFKFADLKSAIAELNPLSAEGGQKEDRKVEEGQQ